MMRLNNPPADYTGGKILYYAISHLRAIPPTSSDIDMAMFDESRLRSQLA